MTDREPTFSQVEDWPGREGAVPPRSDRVRIRLPTGEYEWVTPEAFNLISEREFQDSQQLRRLRKQRNLALGLAAVAVISLLAGSLFLLARLVRSGPVEPAPPAVAQAAPTRAAGEQPATRPVAGPVAAGVVSAEEGTQPPARAEAAAPDAAAIERTVKDWAAAWTAQDVDQYLGFYSPRFQVPGGMDRSSWEQRRRDRLTRPRLLAVTVSEIETTPSDDGTAVARFVQVYRSPGYRDRVLKTLELASESGLWRIVNERSSLLEAGSGPLYTLEHRAQDEQNETGGDQPEGIGREGRDRDDVPEDAEDSEHDGDEPDDLSGRTELHGEPPSVIDGRTATTDSTIAVAESSDWHLGW